MNTGSGGSKGGLRKEREVISRGQREGIWGEATTRGGRLCQLISSYQRPKEKGGQERYGRKCGRHGYQCTKERLKGEGEKPEKDDWVE